MRAAELAHVLGAKRSGRQWKCKCVAHEDASPSMIIFDGRDQLQVRCMAGCRPTDIIAVLKDRGLWSNGPQSRQPHEAKVSGTVSRETSMRDRARALFDSSGPLAGTPAQQYLERRD